MMVLFSSVQARYTHKLVKKRWKIFKQLRRMELESSTQINWNNKIDGCPCLGKIYFGFLVIPSAHLDAARHSCLVTLFLPRELVNRLHQRGVQVFLVSGGFQSIVEHVALQLNIPTANVFANRLKFYFNGEIPLTGLFFAN